MESRQRFERCAAVLGYAYRHIQQHLLLGTDRSSCLPADDQELLAAVKDVLVILGSRVQPSHDMSSPVNIAVAPVRVNTVASTFKSLGVRGGETPAALAPATPDAGFRLLLRLLRNGTRCASKRRMKRMSSQFKEGQNYTKSDLRKDPGLKLDTVTH